MFVYTTGYKATSITAVVTNIFILTFLTTRISFDHWPHTAMVKVN